MERVTLSYVSAIISRMYMDDMSVQLLMLTTCFNNELRRKSMFPRRIIHYLRLLGYFEHSKVLLVLWVTRRALYRLK